MKRGKHRRRRSLAEPEALEEVLDRSGENRFAKRKLPMGLKEWRAAVGARIADRARPYALERGVLIVKVATSVWANELAMLGPELVHRLREHGLAVESLRFRVGPLDMPEVPIQARNYRKVPPPEPLSPEMTKTLETVGDAELRDAIAAAARATLAWQNMNVPRSSAPPKSRK